VDIAVAEFPEEGWLHGRHDVLRAHPDLEIGRADGSLLDAVVYCDTDLVALYGIL
jgi:hypothetical protein